MRERNERARAPSRRTPDPDDRARRCPRDRPLPRVRSGDPGHRAEPDPVLPRRRRRDLLHDAGARRTALYRPVAGSFASYAEEFLGPRLGFITGWTYWLFWVVTGMAEITAAGLYVQYWFRHPAVGLRALIVRRALRRSTSISVALFGELEFWLALIKVAAIVGMIIICIGVLAFRLRRRSATPRPSSTCGPTAGFFPKGFGGTLIDPADRDVRLPRGRAGRRDGGRVQGPGEDPAHRRSTASVIVSSSSTSARWR